MLPIFFRRLFLILTFSCMLNTLFLGSPSHSDPDTSTQRRNYRQSVSDLDLKAGEMARDLVVLDLKIKNREKDIAALSDQVKNTGQERDLVMDEYRKALVEKERRLENAARWINFQYRYGNLGYLEMILGSKSIADLASRTAMATIIISRQVSDMQKAAGACAAARQKETQLTTIQNRLVKEIQTQTRLMEETRKIYEERTTFLEMIRKESQDLMARVNQLEKNLLGSIDLVNYISGALGNFSWGSVEHRLIFKLDGIYVEITEDGLNAAIRNSSDKGLKDISIVLDPGLFILNGKDNVNSTSLSLGGKLGLSGKKGYILFNPSFITVDEIPVSGEVLQEIAGNDGILLSIPPEMRDYKLSRVIVEDGRLTLVLGLL